MTDSAASAEAFLSDYEALTAGAGLVDFSHRTLIELAGDDRKSFLHNLSTNEIRKLSDGAGCEAFLTNVQGKTIGHVLVFSGPETLVLETVPDQADKILAHLDRYLIREKVELQNRSTDWSEWLLAGAAAEALLAGLSGGALPPALFDSCQIDLLGHDVWVRRVDIAGPVGFLLDCRRNDARSVGRLVLGAGARKVGPEACEAARIEAGFPLFGVDMNDQNLPQEVARDSRAISFNKGCYLGQETIARIDALGHVNKTLVGLRFDGQQIPAAGMELLAEGKAAGNVTSAAWSPRLAAPLALGYVRRGSNQLGVQLGSAVGVAEVIALPLG